MSINMTIKSGTTREFPQQGDEDLYSEVTAWANDVTTAINTAPVNSDVSLYDAVVGSAANVTAGIATHSDIATAIAAVAANASIYIYANSFAPAAMIDINKALTIVGEGEGAVVAGDNIATGAVVKISASGVSLSNIKITQGTGTPDYALEIDALIERTNLDIKADGTFATSLFLNGSVAGAVTGFISYDTNSVLFGGENQIFEKVKLEDQTTPAYDLIIESDSAVPILTADRTLTLDCNDGDRTLSLAENLTVADGFNVTVTAEDSATSIVLDNSNFEVESTDGSQRDFKITSAKAGNTTLTFEENLTVADGFDVTVTAEDAATAIVLDNANFEVENTDGTQRNIKITSAKAGDTTLTLQENLTVGDGFDVTITAEDAASSITLDEQTVEFEGEGTTTRLMKFINASDAPATLTLDGVSCAINQDLTTDAAAKFDTVKIADTDASNHLTLDWSEDDAGDRTLDVKVNGADRTVSLTGNLTVEAASIVNQDLSSDATPTFAGITRDSANLTIGTTTSGIVNINPVDEQVIISSASDTSATTQVVKFGDDTGGTSGIRNNSGTMEFQSSGGGWTVMGTVDPTSLGYLANDAYLVASSFPSSTDLYAWHNDGTADFDGSAWIGGVALTEVGALTASTNHLGVACFNDFDGTADMIYTSSAVFDTADEDFTAGGWYKIDSISANRVLFSKYNTTNGDKSFYCQITTGGDLELTIFYDASGNSVTVSSSISALVADGKFHHIVGSYDISATSMTLYLDGKIVGHTVNASLAARNNSANADLTFCGSDGSGTPANFFDGEADEFFYQKTALSFDAIRKLYVTGTMKKAYVDENSKVLIVGEIGPIGYYRSPAFSAVSTTTDTYADAGGGREIYICKTGMCRITYQDAAGIFDSDRDGLGYVRLWDGSAEIPYTLLSIRMDIGVGTYTQVEVPISSTTGPMHFVAGTKITVNYKSGTGDTFNLRADSASFGNGYLLVELLD